MSRSPRQQMFLNLSRTITDNWTRKPEGITKAESDRAVLVARRDYIDRHGIIPPSHDARRSGKSRPYTNKKKTKGRKKKS